MNQILLTGFGGQGILFAGKFLAYAGMLKGHEVTWLPAYGPETRGGTSSCGVIISDDPIGSPVVLSPDILVCMNRPSLDKYEDSLAPGGTLFIDSTLAERKAAPREGRAVHYIPATQLAYDNGLAGLANMILMGRIMGVCGLFDRAAAEKALGKAISSRRQDMLAQNLRAVDLGLAYHAETEGTVCQGK